MITRIVLFILFILSILLCLQLPFVTTLALLDSIWDWGISNMEKWGWTSLIMGLFGFMCCFLIASIYEEYW